VSTTVKVRERRSSQFFAINGRGLFHAVPLEVSISVNNLVDSTLVMDGVAVDGFGCVKKVGHDFLSVIWIIVE